MVKISLFTTAVFYLYALSVRAVPEKADEITRTYAARRRLVVSCLAAVAVIMALFVPIEESEVSGWGLFAMGMGLGLGLTIGGLSFSDYLKLRPPTKQDGKRIGEAMKQQEMLQRQQRSQLSRR